MQVADEHVAGFGMPGVGGGSGVVEFVATAVRQRESAAVSDAGEGVREIGEAVDDKMHHLALALDAPLHVGTAMIHPGDPVELRPEPKNPADPRAVAVYSERGVQMGYLSAERCGLIGKRLNAGDEYRAVFQEADRFKAVIRVRFGGGEPTLPERPAAEEPDEHAQETWDD